MDQIEKRRETQRNFYNRNKKRMIAKSSYYKKKHREANPEQYQEMLKKQKHARMKSKYGLTSEMWWQMFENQGSKCKICKSETTAGQGWHTDHCHLRNKVRGILCYHCNLMLGMVKDNVDTLKKAIDYLKEND